MNNIFQDFTPAALIQAAEDNTIESFKSWTKWAKMDLHEDPGITWTSADIPYFLFNVILNLLPETGTSSAAPKQVIAAAVSRASSRQVPMGWWVGPLNPIPELGQRLEEQGLFHAATLTGMAMDLLKLNEPPPLPPGFTVSPGYSLARGCRQIKC